MFLFVKLKCKFFVQDVKNVMCDYYEGIVFDISNDFGVGFYKIFYCFFLLIFKVGDQEYFNECFIFI